jgi:YihY family inner membrane protein
MDLDDDTTLLLADLVAPTVRLTSEQKTSFLQSFKEIQAQEQTRPASEIDEFQVLVGDVKKALATVEKDRAVADIISDARTLENFWQKIMNDWALNFASGLAYSLLMALFPIIIAVGAGLGFVAGYENAHNLLANLSHIFPDVLANQNVLMPIMDRLQASDTSLSIFAIVLAIFSGSRLFIAIEDYFDIIYHTQARPMLKQNLMAISMLLIFMVLIPIMLLASSIGFGGFLGGLLASWLLFEAVYLIIPNQRISLKNSWLGALVAAFALQGYIALFPLYAGHFLGSYSGNIGFAIILLLFFYYFAVILLLGAEVNAFFAEEVRGTSTNIAGLVQEATLESDKRARIKLMLEKGRSELQEQSLPVH